MVMQSEPIRIGLLLDVSMPDGSLLPGVEAVNFRFQEAVENGELDRPVEIIIRSAKGLPAGSAANVEDAFEELAAERVLGIIGPGVTDNCLVTQPMAESFKIPTLNFPGTEHSRGEFGFHFQLGSLSDEGPMIVTELIARGHTNVGVIRDQSPIGAEYFDYFDQACVRTGLAIASDQRLSPIATDATAQIAAIKASGATALVYLGLGLVIPALREALTAAGWEPPRFMNTAFMHGYANPVILEALEGWVGVDMYDRGNRAAQAFLDRFEKKHGERPEGPVYPVFYDMATMTVEGLRWAPVLTADGFRRGLERVHQLPATCGGEGTVMGFSPWDRAAYKGRDWLLFQTVRNGRFEPFEKA
ncbi:MAG: hypothetical protein JWL70_2613 [Acidimicrobiia bacterium]|nr:hypothetical protein [Acidimicrobiia bacterium]